MIAFCINKAFIGSILLLWTAVCRGADPVTNSTNSETRLGLDVFLRPSSNDIPWLQLRITNMSTETVEVAVSDLPWESRHSITMILVEAHSGNETIPEIMPITVPAFGTQKILPNGILEGNINLEGRYPGLLNALHRTDIIIFWSYRFVSVDRSPCNRCGGWLLIPKINQVENK